MNENKYDFSKELSAAFNESQTIKPEKKIKYIKDHAAEANVKLDTYAAQLVEYLEDGLPYAAAIEAANDHFDIYLLAERLNNPQPKKRRRVTKTSVAYFVDKFRAVDAKSYIRDLVTLLDFYRDYTKAYSHLNAELSDPDYMWKRMGMERPAESDLDKNLRKIANSFK